MARPRKTKAKETVKDENLEVKATSTEEEQAANFNKVVEEYRNDPDTPHTFSPPISKEEAGKAELVAKKLKPKKPFYRNTL